MKINAEKLFNLYPLFLQVCSKDIDNAMAVKLQLRKRALRTRFEAIQDGRNAIVKKHGTNDEKKGGIYVTKENMPAFEEELKKFWQELGEVEIPGSPLPQEDLGKFGTSISTNELDIVAELCCDQDSFSL